MILGNKTKRLRAPENKFSRANQASKFSRVNSARLAFQFDRVDETGKVTSMKKDPEEFTSAYRIPE
jgi:hypothetical protein